LFRNGGATQDDAMTRRDAMALATCLACLLTGCGGSGPVVVPVQGTVTREGKPLAGAAVMFLPAAGGRPATGVTDQAGVFHLQTFKPLDGALLGEHRVSVALPEAGSGPGVQTDGGVSVSGSSGKAVAIPMPTGFERYARPEESGLTATVTGAGQTFAFDLKPQPQK
jgi:hypothetical protein